MEKKLITIGYVEGRQTGFEIKIKKMTKEEYFSIPNKIYDDCLGNDDIWTYFKLKHNLLHGKHAAYHLISGPNKCFVCKGKLYGENIDYEKGLLAGQTNWTYEIGKRK